MTEQEGATEPPDLPVAEGPLALLDANVLLRALASPTSSSAALLHLARLPAQLRVAVTDVILFEFWRNAHEGLRLGGGRIRAFSEQEIEEFLDLWIFPALVSGPAHTSVSRFPELRDARWWNRPALEVVRDRRGTPAKSCGSMWRRRCGRVVRASRWRRGRRKTST